MQIARHLPIVYIHLGSLLHTSYISRSLCSLGLLCANASTIIYQLHLGHACSIFFVGRADYYRACNYNCVTARQHVSNYDNSTVCHSATQYITLRHEHLRGNATQYICTHCIDIVSLTMYSFLHLLTWHHLLTGIVRTGVRLSRWH